MTARVDFLVKSAENVLEVVCAALAFARARRGLGTRRGGITT